MSRTTLVKSMNMQSMRIQYDHDDGQSELSDCEEQIDKEGGTHYDSRSTFVVPDATR